MNSHDLQRHFPNASRSVLAANPGIQNPVSELHKAKQPLEATGGKETGIQIPCVRLTLCRVNLLDVDAKYASVKDVLDGLQHAGIICGDKEGEITLEVEQVKVAHFKDERTEIEVKYP